MAQKTKIIVEQNHEQEIKKFEPRYNELITEGKNLKVIDDNTNVRATELIREIEGLAETYSNKLKEIVKPLKDHVKFWESLVKPYVKALESIAGENSQSGLRGQKADYEFRQSEARRIEEEKLRKEQEEKYKKELKKADKKGEVPPPPPAPIKVEAPKEEGVFYKTEKDFELIIDKEIEIPRGYLMPDEKKIKAGVKPGIILSASWIRVFERKILAVRDEKIENL